jgi:acetylornithine deacetylase
LSGDETQLLELHRELVGIRSVSGEEERIAGWVEEWLTRRGIAVERIGNSVLAHVGDVTRPSLLLNSHLDTVPPSGGWSQDPFTVLFEPSEGRIVGLGANDAKASVAAMMSAVSSFAERSPRRGVWLALVEGEETKGIGTQAVLAELSRRGAPIAGAVFGEPTSLDVAIAQKGLIILELEASGTACHAAHAARLGATNALRVLARDLVALEALDLGSEHPQLGRTTLEPTQASAGVAHNVVPAHARAVLDLRTTPELSPEEIVERVRAVVASTVQVRSARLLPTAIDPADPLVRAALRARPEAELYGSPTLSDMAFAQGIPAIKVGPGVTERSHSADEFVLESELIAGEAFYRRLIEEFSR